MELTVQATATIASSETAAVIAQAQLVANQPSLATEQTDSALSGMAFSFRLHRNLIEGGHREGDTTPLYNALRAVEDAQANRRDIKLESFLS